MKDIIIHNSDMIGKTAIDLINKSGVESIILMKDFKFTPLMHEVTPGTLLGDSYIQSRTGFSARMQFHHSVEQKQYLYHKWEIFKPIIKQLPYNIENTSCTPNKLYNSIKVSTVINEDIFKYWQLFYKNNVKIVPETIKAMMTERGLAFWFMDDGYVTASGYKFATDSFTLDDLYLLKDMLKDGYDIDTNFQKSGISKKTGIQQYNLYIPSHVKHHFKNLIEPYIIDSLKYKLGK